MYKQASQEAGPQPDADQANTDQSAAPAPDDDVVDADFEEVKEDKK